MMKNYTPFEAACLRVGLIDEAYIPMAERQSVDEGIEKFDDFYPYAKKYEVSKQRETQMYKAFYDVVDAISDFNVEMDKLILLMETLFESDEASQQRVDEFAKQVSIISKQAITIEKRVKEYKKFSEEKITTYTSMFEKQINAMWGEVDATMERLDLSKLLTKDYENSKFKRFLSILNGGEGSENIGAYRRYMEAVLSFVTLLDRKPINEFERYVLLKNRVISFMKLHKWLT